jgi:hypothetical protein
VIGVSGTPFKCAAAPYEVALLLEDYLTKKGMRERMKFEFFTPEPVPVPSVGPEIGGKVLEFLRSRGIEYHSRMKAVDVRSGCLPWRCKRHPCSHSLPRAGFRWASWHISQTVPVGKARPLTRAFTKWDLES